MYSTCTVQGVWVKCSLDLPSLPRCPPGSESLLVVAGAEEETNNKRPAYAPRPKKTRDQIGEHTERGQLLGSSKTYHDRLTRRFPPEMKKRG